LHVTFSPGPRQTRWPDLVLLAGMALITLAAGAVLVVSLYERFNAFALASLVLWLAAIGLAAAQAAAGRIDWRTVLGIVLFAMLIRWWSVELTMGVALRVDPMNYTNLATAVLEGRGLITDDVQYGRDLRAYFPPLYPLVLAGWWALLGVSAWSTLALATLTDGVAAWALADSGRRLGQVAAGRVAGLAYFAWPAFALGAGLPQKESLTVLLGVLLLRGVVIWLNDDAAGARRWRHGLWLGLWWGLLALVQASLAIAPAFVALVLIWQRGFWPTLRLGLTALPALLAVLLPWWLRNWLVFGAFVPLTTASGFMANSALVHIRAPFPPGIFDLPEPERSKVMGRIARGILLDNPLGAAREYARSLAWGFAFEEASLARYRHTVPPISAENHARLEVLLQGTWTGLLASATLATWARLRRGCSDPVALYTLALFAAIGLTNIWFEFGERHRLILTPFLLLIAASGWTAWFARKNQR